MKRIYSQAAADEIKRRRTPTDQEAACDELLQNTPDYAKPFAEEAAKYDFVVIGVAATTVVHATDLHRRDIVAHLMSLESQHFYPRIPPPMDTRVEESYTKHHHVLVPMVLTAHSFYVDPLIVTEPGRTLMKAMGTYEEAVVEMRKLREVTAQIAAEAGRSSSLYDYSIVTNGMAAVESMMRWAVHRARCDYRFALRFLAPPSQSVWGDGPLRVDVNEIKGA